MMGCTQDYTRQWGEGVRPLTKHSGCEGNGKLGGKYSKEPWSSIIEGSDIIELQELVECWDEVMHESGQLIETDLQVGETASIHLLIAMQVHQLVQYLESRLVVIGL